jgi:ribonuclease VapC
VIAVDTSALLAIVLQEAGEARFRGCLKASSKALVSAATVLEARMVTWGRLGARGVALLDAILSEPAVEIVPVDAASAEAAFSAFQAYGRGSGHAANLNYGDLFAYALAKQRRCPLLWKGDDFGESDVSSALAAWEERKAPP